jgi:hypothetical protein
MSVFRVKLMTKIIKRERRYNGEEREEIEESGETWPRRGDIMERRERRLRRAGRHGLDMHERVLIPGNKKGDETESIQIYI